MYVEIGRMVKFKTSYIRKMELYEMLDILALEFYSTKLKKTVSLNLRFDQNEAAKVYYEIIKGISRKESIMISHFEPSFDKAIEELLTEEMMLKYESDHTYYFD